jgi:hypothetical protein
MVMNMKIGTIAQAFFWCLFAGVIGIGIGLGAAFPPLNFIAAPFVCPGGSMTYSSQGYTVSPVESVTTVSLNCVDAATGSATEVNMFPTVFYSGLIYGLIIFVVVLVIMAISANRRKAPQLETYADSPGTVRAKEKAPQAGGLRRQDLMQAVAASTTDPKVRLEKLKDMLSSGLITQQEYDQKKKDILEEM